MTPNAILCVYTRTHTAHGRTTHASPPPHHRHPYPPPSGPFAPPFIGNLLPIFRMGLHEYMMQCRLRYGKTFKVSQ